MTFIAVALAALAVVLGLGIPMPADAFPVCAPDTVVIILEQATGPPVAVTIDMKAQAVTTSRGSPDPPAITPAAGQGPFDEMRASPAPLPMPAQPTRLNLRM